MHLRNREIKLISPLSISRLSVSEELRYAGRLIVDALELCVSMAPHADTELRDRLVEATQNCIRARNDAVDASVTFIHKYLRFMDKTYGAAVLTPTFQNTWTQDQRFTK